MTTEKIDGVSVTTQANVYFDGKCVSHNLTYPDGTKKWTFLREGDGNASGCPSPAIGPDGTVYIGTVTPSQTNGAFYAVD